MKRVMLFSCFLFGTTCLAQTKAPPTQAELDAMIRDLQKKGDSIKQAMERKASGNKSIDPRTGRIPSGSLPGVADSQIQMQKLPPRDSARIRTIPNKELNAAELKAYVGLLADQLKKQLSPQAVAWAENTAQQLGYHPVKMENAAMLAWQGGAVEESVLLITDAASRQSGDGLLLTNTGAILDMSGLTEAAIPILRTVVRVEPDNAAANNNLGQAYTAVGLQDSALHYFSRCLSLSPQHPEANNTAGQIELRRGHDAKAQTYFENSIRGSFNIYAYKGLKYLLKDKCRIAPLVGPKVKLPEYFNQFKYHLPRQCLNVTEAAVRKQESADFTRDISLLVRAYEAMEKDAERQFNRFSAEQYNRQIMAKVQHGERILRPFQLLGSIMEAETLLAYQDDLEKLSFFNKQNRQAFKELEEEYKVAYEQLQKRFNDRDDEHCCGEGDVSCCSNANEFCQEANQLKNKYLPRFAQLNEEWQSRNMLVEETHLDNLLYWPYFAAMNRDDFRVRFYQRVVNHLNLIKSIANVKILEPCETEDVEESEPGDSTKLKEPDCPVHVSIRFWIGKLEGDCESIVFKAGEGYKFRFERNFALRETTLSLGIGADLDKLEANGLGIEGGLDLEGTLAAYITFGPDNTLSDGGIIAMGKMKAGLGFESGQKLKLKDGVSLRAGINSGLSFDPGPLTPLWNKIKPAVEKPINSRVRFYNPN